MQPCRVTEWPTVTWSARTVGWVALNTWTTQLSWMLVPGADADGVHVAAHHRVHPDAGVVAQLDVADDLGGGVHVDALARASARSPCMDGALQSCRKTSSLADRSGAGSRVRYDRAMRARLPRRRSSTLEIHGRELPLVASRSDWDSRSSPLTPTANDSFRRPRHGRERGHELKVNPRIMRQAGLRGTRVTVGLILPKVSEGATGRARLDAYPPGGDRRSGCSRLRSRHPCSQTWFCSPRPGEDRHLRVGQGMP